MDMEPIGAMSKGQMQAEFTVKAATLKQGMQQSAEGNAMMKLLSEAQQMFPTGVGMKVDALA